MNNYKKIGVSALAGSLAMVSANAVEYTMTGGLMAVITTQDSPSVAATSGKAIGTATDLSFNASGELDNGFTVDYFMALDTDGAVSQTSSHMNVGMGSLGTIRINNKAGSQANAIDDISPTAYNETWDGLSPDNPSTFGSSTSSGSIDYRIPAQTFEGVTINASVTYDPAVGQSSATKGGVNSASVSGEAYTLTMSHDSGLSLGGGIEKLNDDSGLVSASGTERMTGYIKYSSGGITASYQMTQDDPRNGTGVEGASKEMIMAGIAYTAGDLTVSYGESSIATAAVSDTAALADIDLQSIQAAYTMGAMTISAAMSETSNTLGVTGDNYDESTLAFSFAF
jgi:outer membrane protein OmpU